ncbi:MAG: metalloregulator ArsR/SmtB family transcription factor [Gemmatimonadota bacterium]
MSPEIIELVAGRFRALAEPARLHLMNLLRSEEYTVSDLADASGMSTANVSKHLQVLHGAAFVARRKEGLHVFYRIASDDVFHLCDIMCGQLDAEAEARRRVLGRRT